uniref:Uncharacterized protein n=1 Tax=Solanum tuberosum TaxID=4113 RepID=M1DCZ6_SOLTU
MIDTKLNVQKFIYNRQKCAAKSHLAKQVWLTKPIDEPPFGHFHRLSALAFSVLKFCYFGRSTIASRNYSAIHCLLLSIANLISPSGVGTLDFQWLNGHSATR